MNDWESELRHLPDPLAPDSTTSLVMARVRAMAEESAAVTKRRAPRVPGGTDWRAWGLALGVVSAAAVYLPGLLAGSWTQQLLLPRMVGWMDWTRVPFESAPAAVLMGTGLAVYLIGMGVPIRTETPNPQEDLQ